MLDLVESETEGAPPPPPPRRIRVVAGRVLTALCVVLVLLVLVLPNQIAHLTPSGFLRLPLDGILALALMLLLPPRGRRIAAIIIGVLLGLLAIIKIIGLGFSAVLDRPFDPVLDWPFLQNGLDYVRLSAGTTAAVAAVIGALLLVVGVLLIMVIAVRRVSRVAIAHRTGAGRALLPVVVVWVVVAIAGTQLITGVPIASHESYDQLRAVGAGLEDRKAFAAEVAVDPYRNTPGDQLLTALRGKNVVIALVESYGRISFDDPSLSAKITPLLDSGYAHLRAEGFDARSGWLSSPTAGGGSWLAQSTLMSGVWINNQQRYRELVSSDRLTLNGLFRKASWHTVAVMPATVGPWPEGKFFHLDQIYGAHDMGYKGAGYAFNMMPDEYTLSAFQRLEMKTPRAAPVMAEIPLISSHSPWEPVPKTVPWPQVGDGSTFTSTPGNGDPADIVLRRNKDRVKADYGNAISYSLNTLLSYVETYGDDNLVMVFLGDHQPSTVVSGVGAGPEVPITILAKDPAVLQRVNAWGWDPGLKPSPGAPVWRMDAFRDKFLSTFGSTPSH
jgi:hypothetical protein